MIPTRHTTVALTAALVLAMVGAAAPVAADHNAEDDWLDTSVDNADGEGGIMTALSAVASNPSAVASGLYGRVLGDSADNTAAESEKLVRKYANNRSAAFETWAADHVTASESRDVVRVVYKIDGETDSHIAQANVSGGNYTDLEVVESTSRTVDYECTLEGDAARNAARELADFDEEFVKTGENVTGKYRAKMASRYGGKVTCEEV